MSTRLFWGLLAAILLLSLITHLATVRHGLPEIQVGDENSDLSTALRLSEGQIPAAHVRYHRGLIAYVDAASVGGLFAVDLLGGRVSSVSAFRELYFTDRAQFTLATRLAMTGLALAAILFTALAGRYVSPGAGLLAALALAVNGFFLLNSLYALPDGLVMAAAALLLWRAMRLWARRRGRDYFWAGVALAVVMLSKLSASAAGISLVVAHGAAAWEQSGGDTRRWLRRLVLNRKLLWLALGCLLGNLLLNPLAFLHPHDLVWEIKRLNEYAYQPQVQEIAGQLKIVRVQVVQMAEYAWRWLLPATLLGVLAGWHWRRRAPYWIILSTFAMLSVTIGRVISVNYKIFFWTPWLIPMALLSGVGLDFLIHARRGRGGRLLAWGVTAALLLLEGAFMLRVGSILARPDTRQQALAYIEANWPAGTRVISTSTIGYGVPLQRDETSIERARSLGAAVLESWAWWLRQPPDARPGPAYDVYGPEMQQVIDTLDDVKRLIEQEGIQYVIEADLCTGNPPRPASDSSLDYPPISDEFRARWELVRVFSPFKGAGCIGQVDDRTGLIGGKNLDQQRRPGPVIRIYRVAAGPD